ncbi:MAG: agmatine deiminase family protein [Bacteroidales bacterium]|nr:agmatine deiminase family protein [Bacteroidales bacterium]
MKQFTYCTAFIFLMAFSLPFADIFAQQLSTNKEKPVTLKHWMTPEEAKLSHLIGKGALATDPPPGPVTNFGEFEKMQSVLIRYQFGISYALIAAMSQKCGVTTIVASQNEQNTVTNQYQNQGVNLANCTFIIAPTNSYWTRDYGPWFVFDGNDEIGIVDFEYNRPRPADNAIPLKVSQHLGINYFKTDLLHTGGNYMTDGMGVSASTDIVYTENTNLTHAQINQIMQDYYGIHTYHVLPDPNNTYIDHIDCWGKFLAPDKILIRSVPTTHPQYDEIEATAAYFAAQTSSYGTPLEVFRVYTPNNQPYTNSLILNDRVFVPIMNSSWDDEAIATYQEAMPGYEILGFTGSWESTDALHCRAKGIADLDKVYVRHLPLLAEQPVQASYPVEAMIKTFSGQPLKADSVLIFYRVNGAAWQSANMTNSAGQTWVGNIPSAPPGSQIDYYLFAADQADQRIKHPFIGEPDPHTFFIGSQAFAQISVNPTELSGSAMAGSTTSEILTICNYGNLELYFTIEPNTAVYGNFSVNLPDSPTASAYDYNTYTELGWTDIAVNMSGEIAGIEINYTWTTDNWPEEGSFYLESPSGTQTLIASGNPNGTYSIDMTAFNGQEVSGTWKVWIEDTYGDGGHRATNISIDFTVVESETEWLSAGPLSGVVQPAQCIDVTVVMNATELTAGLYNGQLIVSSNDPDDPEIEIPVEFEVIAMQDVVVTPDTLWFLSWEDMINGKMVNINNPSPESITITEITDWGTNFLWMIEGTLPSLPYQLPAGQNLDFKVVVVPPPQQRLNMLYDNLNITTEYGLHTVVVAWDSDLIGYNTTLTPDTLYFIDELAFLEPQTVTFLNSSQVPLSLNEIQSEGSNEFYWYVNNISVTLPYLLMPQETVTFDVWIPLPVNQNRTGIQYDSIAVGSDAGVDFVVLVCDTDLITGINPQQSAITKVYPSPFIKDMTIEFFNDINQETSIDVMDLQGRKVVTIREGWLSAGKHQIKWNGTDTFGQEVQNGIWFILIVTPKRSEMIKILKLN